jgi:hypothetical protein
MSAGSWTDPVELVLLGGLFLLVGVIWTRCARAARARRSRNGR